MQPPRLDRTPPRFKLSPLSQALYVSFLEKATRLGYAFVKFGALEAGAPAASKFILLRHDVDLSPAYARRMAELEGQHGVAATYFVMLDGQFYNALDKENVKHLRAIQALGHEVGLHFSTRSSVKGEIGAEIEYELNVLSAILEAPVRSYSQHDPVNTGFVKPQAKGWVDAYEAVKRHDLLYVSDSGMMWRQHTFDSALDTGQNLCLLAHPISWLHEQRDLIAIIRDVEERERASAAERFDTFARNHVEYYEKRLAEGV
jgi:hypothetical protein